MLSQNFSRTPKTVSDFLEISEFLQHEYTVSEIMINFAS